MNIALFTETFLPYINGVVTHVKSLRDGLEKLGHNVLVVTADPHARHHYIMEGILHCPAITSKKFYEYGLASPVSHHRLKLLKEFAPDIIHIHNEFGIGLSGVRYANELDIPLVYTLHTMYEDYLYYIAPKPLIPIAKKIAAKYSKYLADNSATLLGPSPKVVEFFKECGVNKQVYVLQNPVELDLFNADNVDHEKSAAIKEKLGLTKDDFIISFCGRLGREKNVDTLLNYWAQTVQNQDHLKLMILGDGPVKEELEVQAQQLGISKDVIFVGKVNHPELPLYYDFCDLYITASLSDTNSISMKEAMAMRLPVLCLTDALNVGQIVDGVNGYNYNNAAEMYQEIQEYRAMTEEEQTELKYSSLNSVRAADCLSLAQNVIPIYRKMMDEYVKKDQKDQAEWDKR